MKIGIITFHWATNYGAILQAYALQKFLVNNGHEVYIINFKPKKFDFSFYKLVTSRAILNPIKYLSNWQKEKVFIRFRNKYLNSTLRYRSIEELKATPPELDVYISGSDQVLNPSFTRFGEDGNRPSSAYFLDFGGENVIRLGYAVSFGCTIYPDLAKKLAQPLLKSFNSIGVRENTGLDILESMNYTNTCVVPDPTLLLNREDYDKLITVQGNRQKSTFIYMLRTSKLELNRIKHETTKYIIADSKVTISIASWLLNLKNAKSVITNSFHGVVFCLHYHVPFIVVLKTTEIVGMNDRFFTLLEPMDLTKYIITENDISKIKALIEQEINWNIVDREINRLKKNGASFFYTALNSKIK